MKVLIVAPADSVHTVRWIERIEGTGIQCILFDMTSKESQQPMKVTQIYRARSDGFLASLSRFLDRFGVIGSYLSSFTRTLNDYRSLTAVIREHNPDLINIHWLFHHAALAASFVVGIPKVATPWGSDLLVPEYKGFKHVLSRARNKLVVGLVVRSADELCCDATHMKSLLVSFGAPANTVNIIYFGTETDVFSPTKRDRNYWSQFGIQGDECVVLSNRVLADMYDIETLLESASALQNSYPKLRFVIVGSGPSESSLKSKVAELGIGSITSFTGRLGDEDFTKATASCDIYVSTSPTDGGIAASVAEAMSCQIPVIITGFGDNESWLKNQTAGLLFQSGDKRQLAECISKLASDPTLREKMGKAGRAVILAENNSKLETQKIKDMYVRVATKAHSK